MVIDESPAPLGTSPETATVNDDKGVAVQVHEEDREAGESLPTSRRLSTQMKNRRNDGRKRAKVVVIDASYAKSFVPSPFFADPSRQVPDISIDPLLSIYRLHRLCPTSLAIL
jgi:hypothetical protein